ncbi:MAG: hypothetical protein Q8Q39_00060, partial [bacterium]|nr:hypothetical protein [bacterium]
ILLVGAAGRVDTVAEQFDSVRFQHRNPARPEFYIIVGSYKGKDVAAMSVGIGTDNVEIAVNELHALFEYDHVLDTWSKEKPNVNIIRVGTCGTPHVKIPVGAFAISTHGLGLDNLGAFYPFPEQNPRASAIENAFRGTSVGKVNSLAYASTATPHVVDKLREVAMNAGEGGVAVSVGITLAAPGFNAPEGRQIGRLKTAFTYDEFVEATQAFQCEGLSIVNFEMETSALFRLGHEQLGYAVGAICVVMDNLATDEFIDADKAAERMRQCIHIALEAIITL